MRSPKKTKATKPHIAMILPDRIDKPVGGMGVQAKYLIDHLKGDFTFSVHGFPDDTSLPYYYGVSNPMPKIGHGGVNTLTCQASYLASIFEMTQKGQKPDLIHVLDYTEYLAGVYAAKSLNVPLVASMQLSAHLMHQANLWSTRVPNSPDGIAIENSMKEMELLGLKEADHIIHVSNLYKKIFSKIEGLDTKSSYIPNGVELKEFEGKKKINLPGNGKRKIIFIGRFAPQKNTVSLLQADIPAEIDLIFVGEKPRDPTLLELLSKKISNNSNIHFIGTVYGEDKVAILKAADAVIIPSLHECHPIVMHEAMAAGCIVLHSGAGDMQEILTNDFAINCGISPQSITNAIQAFASMNNKEIATRKARGLEVVKDYTWKLAAKKTKQVYSKLLKDGVKNNVKSDQNNTNPFEEAALLLTATVAPSKDVPYLTITDAYERLGDYICSMYCYIKQTKIKKIVFCDNSGFKFDYSEIVKIAKKHGKTLEIILYSDNGNASILGKGYGEGKIIKYAIENSTLLQNTPAFYKCTGRLFFSDFDLIVERHKNDGIAFNLDNKNQVVCTRLFKCSKDNYYKYIQKAYGLANDLKNLTVEKTCFDAIRGLEVPNINYGRVTGRSGGKGHMYDDFFSKEVIALAKKIIKPL